MKFEERVWEVLREIPEGRVTTYKAIADRLGTKAYQAVGQACRNNPNAPEVPCHRVVSSDGTIGGYSGKTKGPEINKKIRILKKEGIEVSGGKVREFDKVIHF